MRFNRLLPILALALSLPVAACTSEADSNPAPAAAGAEAIPAAAPAPSSTAAPYAFDAPTASLPLPAELKEVSGVTVLDDRRLAAVQDEQGVLYLLDSRTGTVERTVPFQQGADYEGVELAGDRLFVLLSDGTLQEITGWDGGAVQVRTFTTPLGSKNDTEGIAYDRRNDRLLIATKEHGGKGLGKSTKAVYAFDLKTNTMAAEPVYTLDAEALEGRIGGKGKFKPSALAVHPRTGELYVLSSVARGIVVVDASGQVRHAWPLSASVYEQPEGLAFAPDGTLYITSEGVERPGMLHRIVPTPGA